MSCDAALAFTLHLAMAPVAAPPPPFAFLLTTATITAPAPLAREPLFASIVSTAGALQAQADDLRQISANDAGAWPTTSWDAFKTRTLRLADLDMQGHLELARRGTDGDLKCILRGISQDLPRKLGEVDAAKDRVARHTALDELFYLLRDNVETLTAPARPPV